MPSDKPLAVSQRIAAIFFDVLDAALTSDREWQAAHVRAVDARVRPLVEALELFCGNVGIHEASSFVKTRFPATWEEGSGLLDKIKAP